MGRGLMMGMVAGLALMLAATARAEVTFKAETDRVDVLLDGQRFTAFHYGKQWGKPCLHPIVASTGAVMTRGYPMEKVKGETSDHPWQHGLYFGHGNINGVDFWHEPFDGKIPDGSKGRVMGRTEVREAPKTAGATLTALCHLVHPEGKVLGTLRQEYTFRADGEQRMIDAHFTVRADQGIDLKMGDIREGAFGIRMADAFREDKGVVLTNSEGLVTSKKVWGKPAKWVDYSAKVNGKEVGLAIFDHPANPRHPARWHARDYSLCSVNPFGQRGFDGKLADGSMVIPAGKEMQLRYRVLIHTGDVKGAEVGKRYEAFAQEAAAGAK